MNRAVEDAITAVLAEIEQEMLIEDFWFDGDTVAIKRRHEEATIEVNIPSAPKRDLRLARGQIARMIAHQISYCPGALSVSDIRNVAAHIAQALDEFGYE